MKTQPQWWQKPIVILAHAFDARPGPERDPAALRRLIRWKRKAGFSAEHLLVNYSMFEGKGGEDSRPTTSGMPTDTATIGWVSRRRS